MRFLPGQMASWKLDPILYTQNYVDFKRKILKKHHNSCSEDTYWHYYTFLHMVGTEVHNEGLTHAENMEQIEEGVFYSRSTLHTMEAKYLERIAQLKQAMKASFPNDNTFDCAARMVAHRASMRRQSSRSTRDGKIKNH